MAVNGGWRNASFRGFADYMLTPATRAHPHELTAFAVVQRHRICAPSLFSGAARRGASARDASSENKHQAT